MATATEVAGGRALPRVHWGPVVAGVFLAMAVHIVLGLVGGALGLAARPADSAGLGAGAAIWGLITPFVATALGAWLACRMAAALDQAGSNLHGIMVWAIGLIAGALFLAGTVASGAMTAGASAGGGAGPVQRILGQQGARTATTGREAARTADEGAKAAAATAGGAAIAAIAGFLGAIAGAGIARGRRSGRGWRIAIERREARGDGGYAGGRTEERIYAPGAYRAPGEEHRVVTPPGEAPRDVGQPPVDPYHH